jgi:hypothetical protein
MKRAMLFVLQTSFPPNFPNKTTSLANESTTTTTSLPH